MKASGKPRTLTLNGGKLLSTLELNDDHRLFYERIEGDPQKPCLVFLHEGLGCSAMWSHFPRRLCDFTGCPGLLYDRLGYGLSSSFASAGRTIHYLHDYALGELPRVLEALIPSQAYVLVGHSDGGSIALIFAAGRPTMLKGVISESAHVYVDDKTLQGIRQADRAYDQGKLDGLRRYHGEKTHAIFKAWSRTWCSPWFRHWNIEYLLPSVEAPVLVIQGCEDQYGTLEQMASIVSQTAGPAEKWIVEACGHSPHLDQPDLVLHKMAAFIEAVGGEASGRPRD